jgi:GntR family transcriptional regulator
MNKMMLDFNKGASPLYHQIKEILKEKIENEEYFPGDILPTELEMQNMYNVSRITVRQAINELVNEGYISRTRGKGTVVVSNKIEEKLNRIMSFTEEMKIRGLEPSTKFANISIIKLSKTIANYLEANKDEEAYKIERLRYADDSPLVFFITYFKKDIDLPLDNEVYMGSLYELLKSKGIQVSKAKEHFEAVIADEKVCEYLNIDIDAPVLKRTRISYDTDGNVLEYTICYYRADRYKYSVEIGF